MTTLGHRAHRLVAFAALAATLSGCGQGGGEASPAASSTDFTGVWLGTASVTSTAGAVPVTRQFALALSSTGTALTGKLFDGPAAAPVAAALAGTAREGALDYASTYSICSGTGAGSATLAPGPALHIGFVRNTSCDAGAVLVGTATLARQTPSVQWCTATYPIPAGVAGVVCTLRLVHAVGDGSVTVTPLDAGGPGVLMRPVTYESRRECVDACARPVEFHVRPGLLGSWRYRATLTQGGVEYSAIITVTQG